MKQFLLICSAIGLLFSQVNAANHSVVIVGFTYSPATLTVNVGDVVTIEASSFHPLVQVSEATWNANLTTPLPGGFSSTINFDLTITAAMSGTTIFYLCDIHGPTGMKGKIIVNVAAGVTENRVREFNFTVYPNPIKAGAWLNVSVKKAGRISIAMYDLQGRIINRILDTNVQPGEMTIPFDAARLQKGTYILLMRTSQGVMKKQIVIQ